MRTSKNEYVGGRLINGYDYHHEAWVKDGRYVSCAHTMDDCGCYGKTHEGRMTQPEAGR